jgi:hypothetical protein
MNQERAQKLEEIGFDFNPLDKANEVLWNSQFNQLCEYYERHGHCELFWAADCFTFILNTPTNTPHMSLPTLQVKCHLSTRKTGNWAVGLAISGRSSEKANWIRNEFKSWKKLGLLSIPRSRQTRKFGILSLISCVNIMKYMATVSCFGLSTVLSSS